MIRNIRNYVVPNKLIVCKVLRLDIQKKHIDLSLRRVDSKSRKEFLQAHQKEKNILKILEVFLKDKSKGFKDKVMKDFESLFTFSQKLIIDPSLGKKYGLTVQETKKFVDMLKERIKEKSYKQPVQLSAHGRQAYY